MGIDVYLQWDGQTKEDVDQQYKGFSVTSGDVGYLREAYHGGPYATKVMFPEAWENTDEEFELRLPAAVLKERLPLVLMTAIYRNHVVYEQGKDPADLGTVGEGEAGEKHFMQKVIQRMLTEVSDTSHKDIGVTEEQAKQVMERVEKRELPDWLMAFADFVDLAERKEKETGKPCQITVSY